MTSSDATDRKCQTCGVVRPISMFYVEMEARRAAREGRAGFAYACRACTKERTDARRKPKQDYSDAVKIGRGCADCGIRSSHPEIYDFDHPPGVVKAANVANLLTRGSWQDFVDEINKCEVVCANCHRIRSRQRGHSAFGKTRVSS